MLNPVMHITTMLAKNCIKIPFEKVLSKYFIYLKLNRQQFKIKFLTTKLHNDLNIYLT